MLQTGRFNKAKASFTKLTQLVPKRHPFCIGAQTRIRFCEQLLSLEKKLSSVLAGKEKVSDNEQFGLIILCGRYKKRYRDAAKLYSQLFRRNPKLAQGLKAQRRYQASCLAVLGTSAQDASGKNFNLKERTRLHRQALDWLGQDLKAYQSSLKKNCFLASTITDRMQNWQDNPDLATVRDKKAVAKLPKEEQQAWDKLWSDAQALHKTARSYFTETNIQGPLKALEVNHKHKMKAGVTYIIEMRSKQFDPLLRLQDPTGKRLAENDDIAKNNRNSRIVFTPKKTTTVSLVATSFQNQGRGSYELIIREFRERKPKSGQSAKSP